MDKVKNTRNPFYGRHHSDSARARMSLAKRGVPKSPEHRARLSAAMKGKPKSPEHRAKISAALKRRNRVSGEYKNDRQQW